MNTYSYYDNEVNYIARQIKKMFNFEAVYVDCNLKAMWYKITFKGHQLLAFRTRIIHFEELRTKSYLEILKEIGVFMIYDMEFSS